METIIKEEKQKSANSNKEKITIEKIQSLRPGIRNLKPRENKVIKKQDAFKAMTDDMREAYRNGCDVNDVAVFLKENGIEISSITLRRFWNQVIIKKQKTVNKNIEKKTRKEEGKEIILKEEKNSIDYSINQEKTIPKQDLQTINNRINLSLTQNKSKI